MQGSYIEDSIVFVVNGNNAHHCS